MTPIPTHAHGSAVRCDGLVVGYNGTSILDGVSFAAPTGSTTTVVGPSGCGKTTLLKTLAGILSPIDGRATVLGHELPRTPPRGEVGYIPQTLGLVLHTTALRSVLHGCLPDLSRTRSLLGRFPPAAIDAAEAALGEVGLEEKKFERIQTLSGGQQRRVAIARALVQAPRVLLADEILSELDVETAGSIVDLLERLQTENDMTVLLVEHDPSVVEAIADQVFRLDHGAPGHPRVSP